jgi:hypothetical protein
LALRGFGYRVRDGQAATSSERAVLRALHELGPVLYWADPGTGAVLHLERMRRALELGEAQHVASVLATEAFIRATRGQEDGMRLFAEARALIDVEREPELLAWIEAWEGSARAYSLEHEGARKHLESAHELLTTRCEGQSWLLTSTRAQLGLVWSQLGEHALLARHSEEWLREARERRDRFALGALIGYGHASMRLLLLDRPEDALQELGSAAQDWPTETTSMVHLGTLMGRMLTHLYRGGGEAIQALSAAQENLGDAFLIETQLGRLALAAYEAAAALQAVGHVAAQRDPELRGRAAKRARALQKHKNPYWSSYGELLLAVISVMEGQHEQGLTHARAAHAGYTALNCYQQYGATYLIGVLEGGEAGADKRGKALAFFEGEGWGNPLRALATCVPGLHALELS